jgi:hypothetical protein
MLFLKEKQLHQMMKNHFGRKTSFVFVMFPQLDSHKNMSFNKTALMKKWPAATPAPNAS